MYVELSICDPFFRLNSPVFYVEHGAVLQVLLDAAEAAAVVDHEEDGDNCGQDNDNGDDDDRLEGEGEKCPGKVKLTLPTRSTCRRPT